MVDPFVLTLDMTAVVIELLVPGLAWALLFVLAWLRPAFAESLGLGRRAFWLLLPGSLAATFALLPVVPVDQDVLALSFSGAIFPLLVATVAVGRFAPPLRRSAARLVGALAAETAVLLGIVLAATAPPLAGTTAGLGLTVAQGADLYVSVGTVVVAGAGAVVLRAGTRPESRPIGPVFLLASAVMLFTFLGSVALPGQGIVEGFPYFLLPPVGAGFAAVAFARRIFPGKEAFALPAAFFASAWGTTLGADVLRQPGLYAPGPGGIYVIGGAGVLDLVYLSGFLALGGAVVAHVLSGRSWTAPDPGTPLTIASPTHRLREAFDLARSGDAAGSLRTSADAARSAAEQARRLRGAGAPTDPSRPWDGLPVPGWVVSDHANLANAARSGTHDPAEAIRGWATARWLVRLGAELGYARFAAVRERAIAFLIDLALVGAVSGAIFTAAAFASRGSLDNLLVGVGFNAAIYACISGAFLYFILAELWAGKTVGKRLVGIEVRDRADRRPDGLSALVRNVSLVPTLTLLCLGLGVVAAILVKGFAGVSVGGVGIAGGLLVILSVSLFLAVSVALLAGLGVIAILISAERQRLGDLWAGTWVVRTVSPASGPGVRPTVAPPPGRSG